MSGGEGFASLVDVCQVGVSALQVEDAGLTFRRLPVRKTTVEKIGTGTAHAVLHQVCENTVE